MSNSSYRYAGAAALVIAALLPVVVGPSLAQPPHHSDDGYRNPYLDEQFARSRFFTYVQMRFFGAQAFADYEGQADRVPRVDADRESIQSPDPSTMQVTWLGHSTVLLQHRGLNILTDPALSDRASPVSFAGPRRFTPAALRAEELPPLDYAVISHNHYDHLDVDTVMALGNRVKWLVPMSLKAWFTDRGIDNVEELDWGQSLEFEGLKVTATPSQHFSGRNLWDFASTLWCSWVIEIDDMRVWFGGDTGYNPVQFKRIGEDHGPFDLGLIPIGAYEPRWFMKPMHVDPREAVTIHREIQASSSIGIHWGTFRLSAEPIDAPMLMLEEAATAAGVDFTTLAIGETRTLNPVSRDAGESGGQSGTGS
jgi:N-acyl-phosphatidylethanolamine-hydrolysing phospholipase D